MDSREGPTTSEWVDQQTSARDPDAAWEAHTATGLARLQARRVGQLTRRRRWTWAAAAAIVVCLCLPRLSMMRAFAARCVEACVGVTTRVGQFFRPVQMAEDAAPAAAADVDAGRSAAPDFELTDARGDRVRLSAMRGSVVLVNFWATWCAPCKIEIPWFAEFQARYRDRGLVIVGVSLDEEGWKVVRPFAEHQPINYRMTIGSEALAQAYGGIDVLPSTFVVDRQGRIAARHVGLVTKDQYEGEIVRLLTEKK